MSITVSFTTDSKRENSTKQLTMSATHDCTFKNGCSMLNPTLLLELETSTFPAYTAFKIENRYYNITDVRSVRNNLFEVSGEVDVLATYKSNILATTAYVIYDSTNNTELPDNRLPMKTTKTVDVATAACPFVPDGGCFILSLTGAHGTTGVYKVSENELAALIDDIADVTDNIFDYDTEPQDPTYPSAPSVASDVMQSLIDTFGWLISTFSITADWLKRWFAWWGDAIKLPISQIFGTGNLPQNIRECRYIPFNVGTTLGYNTIYLGTFKTKNLSLGKLNTETVHRTTSVSIPWQASDYRRRSPYTEIYLYLPYIGMIKLSSENLIGQSSLSVSYTLALRDGSLIVTVSSGGEIIGQYSGNVGASAPVGVSNINLPKAAQSVIAGMVSIANKKIGAIGMSAIDFGESVTPNYSCIGGLDGIAAIAANQNITCYTVFHDTIVSPNSQLQTIGSPTMSPKSLATLTNYVQTMSASVEGTMTSDERTKLNNLLDAGIFIE